MNEGKNLPFCLSSYNIVPSLSVVWSSKAKSVTLGHKKSSLALELCTNDVRLLDAYVSYHNKCKISMPLRALL